MRGSEARPRSPGEVDPDAPPLPSYPPTGAVPRPRRSTASTRTGRPGSRESGRHPAVEPRTETPRPRAGGGHRAVDRGRPAEPGTRATGGHPTVERAADRAAAPGPRSRASGRSAAVDRSRPAADGAHPSGPLPVVDPAGAPRARRPRALSPRALPPGGGPAALARVGLHLALAALPLLAISAQVFGVLEMRAALGWLIVPAVIAVAGLAMFAPHPVDRILTAGLVWGVVGCVLYDLFRLDTVYVLGWWGDFIPSMGSWVSGGAPGAWDGAVVGYLWRYIGDGGGIGITFFVLAAAVGLNRWSRRKVVLAAVGFAVFPVWAGLIGTVALAPRGEEMLFPLTPVTVVLSLIGHLIFGVALGLGFWRSRSVVSGWPWPALELPRRGPAPHTTSGPPTAPGQPASRRSRPSSSQVRPVANSASRSWS